MPLDRRLLLQGAVLGLGAFAGPAWAQGAPANGFTHSVASGEPGSRQVLLWTRYLAASGQSATVAWEVAHDADFGRIAARGEAEASPESDWCVKAMASGLAPGEWYFFRFRAPSGELSPVGRTRTLPEGEIGKFTLAVVSCANLPFGYFNAYGHAAAREDIDLVVHLGDYTYEYGPGRYPGKAEAVAGRLLQPDHESVALADYRLRHATYRADPQLERLHRLFPMIVIWDDHDTANNSWAGGAKNHQARTEGPWTARKAAALRAFREWLPVSNEDWASYRIGRLADLFRLDTRLAGRMKQLDLAAFLKRRTDKAAAIAEFRDDPWQDPKRTLMGLPQEAWLAAGLQQSVRDGVAWQVLAQQVIMGSMRLSQEVVDAADRTANAAQKANNALGMMAADAGLPLNYDAWDGYPAARARLLSASRDADANLVVLAGDSHNAWAFELAHEDAPAGVEFAVQSVTSPGLERSLPAITPRDLAASLVARNPQLRWAQTERRGYLTLTLTPTAATSRWTFMATVREPSLAVAAEHAISAPHDARRFAAGSV